MASGHRQAVRQVWVVDGAPAVRVSPPRAAPISICRHPARAKVRLADLAPDRGINSSERKAPAVCTHAAHTTAVRPCHGLASC
jgi:hypothetical protein